MSNKYTILALLAGIILLLSWSANPPNGNTDAPGEGVCSNCHTLGTGTQNGMITISGIPASITPSTAYTITMTSSNPNGVAELAGFQLTILNSSNQQAGTITMPSAGSTTQSSGGRQYWEHNPSQMYPASNIVTWTATWTSPSGPANTTITAYAAGNIANGNGSSTGDLIVTTTESGMLMGGGNPLMVSILTFNNVSCFGANDGSATAQATGGSTPYSYLWSNGASGATVFNLPAGTYTVTVTDNASATATASVTITQPPNLVLNTPSITHVTCNGGNNGSITASASGGAFPYFFNWSNGNTGATISNLAAGSYSVTVTDDNGCTKSATYTVTQPAAMVITLVNLEHESCAGEEDGLIQISVAGGVTPYFAEWSNGSIGLTINNLAPDVYTVTVTDNNDCTKTATYTVNAGGTVDVNLNQIQNVTCFGGANGAISVTATGGVAPYTYNWSNGMTGSSITGLAAGSYLVTVTDANNCAVVEGYTVTQPTAVDVIISQTSQNQCFGDATADLTASASGGNGPYTGLWSNGTTGMVNSNLAAGTYTITVTDASGCTGTESVVVGQPAQLTVSVATTDETSAGANNGTATANAAGGTGVLTYLWSQGSTTQTINNLSPGQYCVTVTDANGCTSTGCGQVDAFGCNIDVSLGLDQTICIDDTVNLIPAVTGAVGTVTYVWSDGSTGSSLQVTAGGEYCVSVSDQANCQDADCMVMVEDTIQPFDCPVINESAPGANDGAIDCAAFPGIVSYLWSNGSTSPSISGLAPGQYCVTVTNALGCTLTQCFTVQPAGCQMSVTAAITNVACNGDSTGSITLTVNGATAPVTYSWSNGTSSATNSNLTAGTYSVTITDALNCVLNETYSVTEAPPIVINVDTVKNIDDTPGYIQLSVSGGNPPYTYAWTLPNGGSTNTEDIASATTEGYYSVTVTDASGCTETVDSIFVDTEVSVNSVPKFKSLKVFPVPANDVLIIDFEKQITEVLVTGIDGRMIRHIKNPSSNRLEISDLETGWYLLRMFDGKDWYIARIVK